MSEEQDLSVAIRSQFERFVEGDNDLIGALALSNVIHGSENEAFRRVLPRVLASYSDEEISVLRDASAHRLEQFIKRQVNNKIDALKSEVYQSTYTDIIRANYAKISGGQEDGFSRVEVAIERSGGVARQVLISVLAAFVFGVVLALAPLLGDPLKSIYKSLFG